MAKLLGLKGDSDEALFSSLIQKIEEIKSILKLPSSIKEALFERATEQEFLESVDELAYEAFDDQCTGANPRYPLVQEIKELYLRAYYGKTPPLKD